jgi:hypothetical protein
MTTKLYLENLLRSEILGDLGVNGRIIHLFQRARGRGWGPDLSGW